jgi:uncharacterized membrane protein
MYTKTFFSIVGIELVTWLFSFLTGSNWSTIVVLSSYMPALIWAIIWPIYLNNKSGRTISLNKYLRHLLVCEIGIVVAKIPIFLHYLMITDHYTPKAFEVFRITTFLDMGLILLLFLTSATFISIRNDKITKKTG